jgi:hypothetical protein
MDRDSDSGLASAGAPDGGDAPVPPVPSGDGACCDEH